MTEVIVGSKFLIKKVNGLPHGLNLDDQVGYLSTKMTSSILLILSHMCHGLEIGDGNVALG